MSRRNVVKKKHTMQKHEIDFYFKMVEQHNSTTQKSFNNLDKVFNDKK